MILICLQSHHTEYISRESFIPLPPNCSVSQFRGRVSHGLPEVFVQKERQTALLSGGPGLRLGDQCPFLFATSSTRAVNQFLELGSLEYFLLRKDNYLSSSQTCWDCDLEGITQSFLAQITFCGSDYSGLYMLVSIKKLHSFE